MFRDMLHLFIYFNIDRAYAQYYNTMGCRAGIQSLTYLSLQPADALLSDLRRTL